MPHLSSKFEVSTFSRSKAKAFSASCCRIRNFARKKTRGLPTQSVVAEVPKKEEKKEKYGVSENNQKKEG